VTSSQRPAGSHPHAFLVGTAVAVVLHGLVGLLLALVPTRAGPGTPGRTVEIDVTRSPPPAPSPEPPPPEPVPPPTERHPVVRRHQPRPLVSSPMPNRETKSPPSSDEQAQPVFGVTEDSVVAGDSPVAVPVGNTLMTKDRTLAKAPPAPLPPAPPPAFAPVDEEAVSEFPEVVVKPEPTYPELAQRMGVGGRVRLKLGIDRKGNVKSVRVLEKAGYGMDEEAVRVVWQYKFRPAKGKNGQPVDFVITYNFTFRSPVQ
jgi:protein TonB